jgi:hypothetical protein
LRQVWKRVPSVWPFHQVKNWVRKVFIEILLAGEGRSARPK